MKPINLYELPDGSFAPASSFTFSEVAASRHRTAVLADLGFELVRSLTGRVALVAKRGPWAAPSAQGTA